MSVEAIKKAVPDAALSAAEPVEQNENPMRFFADNVDNWGALEWFNRLVDACEDHDRKRTKSFRCEDPDEKDILSLSADTSKMIMSSSAFQLARNHKDEIRSALSAQAQDLAAEDVLSEVRRQVEVEEWSADHDDAHDKGEMAGAAACYALEGVTYTAPDHYPPRKKYAAVVDARNSIPEKERETTREAIKLALGEPAAPRNWPWHASWWKPTTTRRNLVKAAALLISEIKRLDRAAAPYKQEGGHVTRQ